MCFVFPKKIPTFSPGKHDFSWKLEGWTGLQGVSSNLNIRETLNLLSCADRSQYQYKKYIFIYLRFIWQVRCHMSLVTCHMSLVTCHMSLTPSATATNPPPTNSPNMLRRIRLLILTYIHKLFVAKANEELFFFLLGRDFEQFLS